MAKNTDVIKAFVNGEKAPKTKNLKVGEDYGTHTQLINYNTVIAERYDIYPKVVVIVNETKYSVSTTTTQNALKRELDSEGISYQTVDGITIGSKTL